MKEYNCPDCERVDSCEGCPRTLTRNSDTYIEHIPPYFPDSMLWDKNIQVPNCCKNCRNHPINGGSGVCHCTLPLYDPTNPYRITCSTNSSNYFISY